MRASVESAGGIEWKGRAKSGAHRCPLDQSTVCRSISRSDRARLLKSGRPCAHHDGAGGRVSSVDGQSSLPTTDNRQNRRTTRRAAAFRVDRLIDCLTRGPPGCSTCILSARCLLILAPLPTPFTQTGSSGQPRALHAGGGGGGGGGGPRRQQQQQHQARRRQR